MVANERRTRNGFLQFVQTIFLLLAQIFYLILPLLIRMAKLASLQLKAYFVQIKDKHKSVDVSEKVLLFTEVSS